MLCVVLRCHRRSKSTGTHSRHASLFGVHRSRRVARRCNPTHACCCGMVPRTRVPRLMGTSLAGSIGHGAGPFPVAGWGIMDQRSRRIPREYPGSPGETKDPNRSPNSETDPGTDLNHQGADHVFLDIGPAIRILQLNIEGISAAKREILSTICSKHLTS